MQCLIVLFAVAAACSGQLLGYAPYAYAPALRTQYHAQDALGQYSFGYSGGPSAKQESSAGGVTQGAFSYVDAHGLVQSRSYVADPVNGFRVAGSDIPVDANTPIATHPLAILARKRRQVSPFAYTTAVAAPIAAYSPAYAPAPPLAILAHKPRQVSPFAYTTTGAAPIAAYAPAYAPAHPADTPEVAHAKVAHYAQYNYESVRNSQLAGRKKRSLYAYAAPIPAVAPIAPIAYHAAPIAYHAAPIAAPVAHATAPVHIAAPVAASSQYHAQDELGQYSYGYSNPLSSKSESRSANGVTQGGYSYVDAHGLVQSASYVSDPAHGFRVAATNLPVAPVAQ